MKSKMTDEDIIKRFRFIESELKDNESVIITLDRIFNTNTATTKLIANYFYYIDIVAEQTGIHKSHCFDELLAMCIQILITQSNKNVEGDIIEFGCYTGISTSKLSIIANLLDKKLIVFDSFQGLPSPKEYGVGYQKEYYKEGAYSSTLKNVINVVSKFGISDCVFFSRGWFKDTLSTLGKQVEKISYCFIDVDLAKSFIECLDYVLPRLQVNGIIFSHEASDEEYQKIFEEYGLFDKEMWHFKRIKKLSVDEFTNTCFFIKKK